MPSKPLRDGFWRILGPSRARPERISLDRGDVFDVFTNFFLHTFLLSLRRRFATFSDAFGVLERAPGPICLGQKGRVRQWTSPFSTYMCPRSPLTSQMVPPEVPKRPQNVQFWDLMELCGSPQKAFFGIWRLRSNVGQALLCSTFISNEFGVLLELLLKLLRAYLGSFVLNDPFPWRIT